MIGILRSALPPFPGGIAPSSLSIEVPSQFSPRSFQASGRVDPPGQMKVPKRPKTFQVIPRYPPSPPMVVHPTGAKAPEGEEGRRENSETRTSHANFPQAWWLSDLSGTVLLPPTENMALRACENHQSKYGVI